MKTIIEVGANWGDDTERLHDGGRNVVYAFEPIEGMAEGLRQRFQGKGNVHVLQQAVDLEEGTREINVDFQRAGGASSLYPLNPEIDKLWPDRKFGHAAKQVVAVVRLDAFIERSGISAIDYLWVDAQGNDFRVLQSMGDKLSLVKEGKCEAALTVSLYADARNNVSDIVPWLKERGFECAVVPDALQKEADVHFRRAPQP